MNASKKILRWLGSIPAGIVAAALVAFPLHWLVMKNLGSWGTDPIIEIRNPETLRSIESLLQAALGPLAFIYFSSRTAPNHRQITSVILSGITVVGLPIFAAQWNAHTVSTGHGVLLEHGIGRILANIGGAAGAIYLIRAHERKRVSKNVNHDNAEQSLAGR